MNNRTDILDSEKALLILKEIEISPNVTQRYLAQKLAISLGKINFLINALVDKGMIKIENFKTSKNKWGYIYILTPHGIKTKLQLTHRFLTRKIGEYERLKQEIKNFKREISINSSVPQLEKASVSVVSENIEENQDFGKFT